jgi:hypothetical protein
VRKSFCGRARSVASASTLPLLLVAVIVASCGGQNGTTPTPSASSTSSHTPAPVPTVNPQYLTAENPAIDAVVAGLHVDSGGFDCGSGVVLASSRLTYDVAEIKQLRAYWLTAGSKLPATLRSVTVGFRRKFLNGGPGCAADLQLTNTGSATVEVLRIGVKYLAVPIRNTYHYRFIDLCTTVYLRPNCVPGMGGVPKCGTYRASPPLGQQAVGTVATAPLVPDPDTDQYGTPCPSERPLKHGETIEIFAAPSPNHSSTNLVYSMALVLVLRTASGVQQTILVPHSTSTLVDVDTSQYACYGLAGPTTFKRETQGSAALNLFTVFQCD